MALHPLAQAALAGLPPLAQRGAAPAPAPAPAPTPTAPVGSVLAGHPLALSTLAAGPSMLGGAAPAAAPSGTAGQSALEQRSFGVSGAAEAANRGANALANADARNSDQLAQRAPAPTDQTAHASDSWLLRREHMGELKDSFLIEEHKREDALAKDAKGATFERDKLGTTEDRADARTRFSEDRADKRDAAHLTADTKRFDEGTRTAKAEKDRLEYEGSLKGATTEYQAVFKAWNEANGGKTGGTEHIARAVQDSFADAGADPGKRKGAADTRMKDAVTFREEADKGEKDAAAKRLEATELGNHWNVPAADVLKIKKLNDDATALEVQAAKDRHTGTLIKDAVDKALTEPPPEKSQAEPMPSLADFYKKYGLQEDGRAKPVAEAQPAAKPEAKPQGPLSRTKTMPVPVMTLEQAQHHAQEMLAHDAQKPFLSIPEIGALEVAQRKGDPQMIQHLYEMHYGTSWRPKPSPHPLDAPAAASPLPNDPGLGSGQGIPTAPAAPAAPAIPLSALLGQPATATAPEATPPPTSVLTPAANAAWHKLDAPTSTNAGGVAPGPTSALNKKMFENVAKQAAPMPAEKRTGVKDSAVAAITALHTSFDAKTQEALGRVMARLNRNEQTGNDLEVLKRLVVLAQKQAAMAKSKTREQDVKLAGSDLADLKQTLGM